MHLRELRHMNGGSWNKRHGFSERLALPRLQLLFHKHQSGVLAVLFHHTVAIRHSVRCVAEHNMLQQQPVLPFRMKILGERAKRRARLGKMLTSETEQRRDIRCSRGDSS